MGVEMGGSARGPAPTSSAREPWRIVVARPSPTGFAFGLFVRVGVVPTAKG
jgi:hypothetical protein